MKTFQYQCPKCTYIGRFVAEKLSGYGIICSSCKESSDNKKSNIREVVKKTCSNCCYYIEETCRYNPPIYIHGNSDSAFPRTSKDSWCGKWSKDEGENGMEYLRRI